MTLPLWSTPFTDDLSLVSAAFLNGYVRTQIPKAVDGVGGGIITPSSAIEIQGTAGLKINGTGSAERLQYGSTSETRTNRSFLLNNDTGSVKAGSIVIGTPAEQGIQYLLIPDGSLLTAVTTYHNRNDTGNMPAARVSLSLWKSKITDGVVTQIGGTTTDPNSTVTPYQAHHGFSISSLTETIDNENYVYYAIFNGESGADATTTTWYGCTWTATVSSQDKAA